ncbi:hypothetical protein Tco_0044898 [Tanacetum coccineum]
MTGPLSTNTDELLTILLDRLGLNNTPTNASISPMGTDHSHLPNTLMDNIVYTATGPSPSSYGPLYNATSPHVRVGPILNTRPAQHHNSAPFYLVSQSVRPPPGFSYSTVEMQM